eukprot:EG_transcript_757
MAALAATLSGVFLSRAFTSQQAESELAQRNLGEGQVRAITLVLDSQMDRMRTHSDANTRQLAMWVAGKSPAAFSPDQVIQTINETLFAAWAPQIRANGSVNGFGLTVMYPPDSPNGTVAQGFGMWKDILHTGVYEYVYSYPEPVNNITDAYEVVWTDFANPQVGSFLYSYDAYALNWDSYMRDDYFSSAVPWLAVDGNAYWTITHQRSLPVAGVTMVVQTWDVGIDWRDRLLTVCSEGAEMVIIDNNDMVMAATTTAEVNRLNNCNAQYVDGVVHAACLQIPAAQYPVAEIRDLRNALYTPQWSDLNAPAMPVTYQSVMLNGRPYMVVVATLFSSGHFRATVLWYQPWTEPPTNEASLITIICVLTVLSTIVLTIFGHFGILRPLIQLGRSMRTVAHNLKYGDGGGGAKGLVQRHSFFSEVLSIQLDFETIVMDFLGFSSTKKAAEQADTVLNHILKNTMADAAACIQLYADGKASQVAPDLAQAVTCLARGMQWCRKRHVLMRMAEGDYLPALHPVALQEFGERLVRGRAVISSFPNEVVLLDEVLCDILLDNALNNAFRHGNPANPCVMFQMELAPAEESASSGSQPVRQLTFRVSNQADPAKPVLTPELLDILLSGRTADEGAVYRSALSEHLGLHHMFRVAQTHQMTLTLEQECDTVVLYARLQVQLAKEPTLSNLIEGSSTMDTLSAPPGLHIWALDDSPIARRLLAHSLPRFFPGATVEVLGASPDEVPKFIAGAAVDADIVILDQHLDYSSESFLGTAVLADLLGRGCRAFMCIRSASVVNGSDAAFRAAGAHCALGKDLRPEDFFLLLKRYYRQFLAHLPTASNPSLTTRARSVSDSPLCGVELAGCRQSLPLSPHPPYSTEFSPPQLSLYAVESVFGCPQL